MKYLIIALLFVINSAFAWEPTKPITVTIGFAPGSGNEIAFRKVSSIVQKQTGANFIIENKPGADTVIAMNQFVMASPDGYSISVPSQMSTYVTNDVWEKSVKKFKYDSFSDVITIGKSPLVLIASVNSKVNTPKEFILYCHSGKLVNIAVGSGAHRAAYDFISDKLHFTSEVQPIKFNGPLPAATSVASYNKDGTEFGIVPISVARALIDANKVKPIGMTGEYIIPGYENVPLLNSLIPDINIYAAWYISLPPNTNKEIVSWYRNQFKKALLSKEYNDWAKVNLVFVEKKEFTDSGIAKNREYVRNQFLPILESIESK